MSDHIEFQNICQIGMPNKMPAKILDYMPHRMPPRMSEYISDRMP